MAKRKRPSRTRSSGCPHAKKKLMCGALLFVFGFLIEYMNFTWPASLMVIGALVFLKGLIMKMK